MIGFLSDLWKLGKKSSSFATKSTFFSRNNQEGSKKFQNLSNAIKQHPWKFEKCQPVSKTLRCL